MSNIIEVYPAAGKTVRTAPVWQYDYGQTLHVNGLELPASYKAEFSNTTRGDAIATVQTTDEITIPAQFLESGAAVYIWLVVVDESSRTTEYALIVPIAARAKPTDEEPTPEEQSEIDQTLAALNRAVIQTAADVEAAGEYAEEAKQSAEDATAASENAIAAKDAAVAAQNAAETAQAQAAQSAQSAEGSAGTATSAANAAASAKDAAIAAQSAAENAAVSAGNSAASANTAAQNAGNAAQSAASSASDASQSATAARQAATAASGSANAASDSAASATSSASAAAQSASNAESAKTAAKTAQGSAETAASNASDSAQAAAQSAADIAALGNSVAKEPTAQDILDETMGISANLNELVEINRSIRYYTELPEEGTEGYTYITPDGIFHFENGEYIQVSGGGDLNGFSLAKDAHNRVVLSYVNPEDETDTDSAVMATGTTGDAIVAELRAINASLYRMIPN